MWETILNILQWQEIADTGVDAVVYFSIASFATVLFIIRLTLMLFVGDDGGDVDFINDDLLDAGDIDHLGSGAAFNLFSLLSVLAFLMGVGWMGLAGRLTWGLGSSLSLMIAIGSGLVMMFMASGLMLYVRRLEHIVQYDIKSSLGKTGRVYLTIPGEGKGMGQVQVSVSGRRKVIDARTNGPKIDAFTHVKVVDVGDNEVLIVEAV